MKRSSPIVTGSLFCALLLAGCASKVTEPEQYSGFLADYSRLQPATSPTGQPVMRWLALTLILGMPLVGVIGVAWLGDAVSTRAAWAIALPILGIIALFSAWHTLAAWRVLRSTDEIAGMGQRTTGSDWDALTMIGELGVTMERLRQTLLDEKGQVALQTTTADAILNALPDPVLLLDGQRTIARANFAARKFFGNDIVGNDLTVALRHPTVLDAADSVLSGETGMAAADLNLPVPDVDVALPFYTDVLGFSIESRTCSIVSFSSPSCAEW